MISKFNLVVHSREGIIYQGEVSSITSYNKRGKFDVLERHANFISIIMNNLVIRDLAGKIKEISVSNGLMRVRGGSVEVYVGIEELKNSANALAEM